MEQQPSASRDERIHDVLEAVTSQGTIAVKGLADQLGVSLMTVYRDVSTLEASGLIQRSHGRVTAAPFSMAEASSLMRMGTEIYAKQRIAAAALELVKPGTTIAMDDSTTCRHLFPGLGKLAPLTVVTNACFIAAAARETPELELIQLGGHYLRWADAYAGAMTESMVDQVNPDQCIMSSSSITNGVCSHPDETMGSLKARMMRSTHERILLVDRTKFTRRVLHRFMPLDEVDVVITEKSLASEYLEMLKATVKRVVTV